MIDNTLDRQFAVSASDAAWVTDTTFIRTHEGFAYLSVVIDLYFSTGGIGQFFVNSALNRDYSVIMGITILTGALTVLFNLVVDVLYAWIDPKIRL